MQIDSTLQIGAYHLQHCEDYLHYDNLGTDRVCCAVMDGCTMGTDSYFIATLAGKLLRKILKARNYLEFYQPALMAEPLPLQLKNIMRSLFDELKLCKNQLQLGREELLTTIIVLLANEQEGLLLVVGDGVVSIDGQVTVFEQDNKPDYLGYHLQEDFDQWYAQQAIIPVPKWQDISIATDGIDSFKALEGGHTDVDPVSYLLTDLVPLDKKLKYLEHEAGLRPTDDLAVIRVRSSRGSSPTE